MVQISGFTFLFNAVKNDYPFVESINSLLPLVNEYVIVVVLNNDGTFEKVQRINSDRIKIIPVRKPKFEGRKFLSYHTQMAFERCRFPFCIYLQADEVLHEKDIPYIRSALNFFENKKWVDGFVFKYLHFYGSYRYYHQGYGWYEKEIRIVRNNPEIHSIGDAKSFRKNGKRLHCIELSACIYHYGWVKSPLRMQKKRKNFHRLITGKELKEDDIYSFKDTKGLKTFSGTHPSVMTEYIRKFKEINLPIEPPEYRRKAQKLISDISERTFKRRLLTAHHYLNLGKFHKDHLKKQSD